MYLNISKRICISLYLKGLWLTVCLCAFFSEGNSQTWNFKAPDSLISAVAATTGSKKADALNRLAQQTLLFSTTRAVPIVKAALRLTNEIHYQKGEADALENLALLIFKRGDFRKAIQLMNSAARIYKLNKNYEAHINCLILEASYYEFINDKGKILDTYLEALNASKEIGRLDLVSKSESYLGRHFMKTGDKTNARAYIGKARMNSIKSKNKVASWYAMYATALYNGSQKQYRKAINDATIALRTIPSANENQSRMSVLSSIGDFYLESKKHDSAFLYYNKAIKQCEILNDAGAMATLFTRKAHIFQLEQKLDSALAFQHFALKLRQLQGNITLTGSSLTNIGILYALMHDYPTALNYYDQGLAIAKQTGYLNYIQFNYKRLYDLYLSEGNYKKAIDYNLLLSAINDSILHNETRMKFSRIQSRFDDEQKQKAIEFLTKENDIQKLKINQTRFMIYILGALLILLIAIGVLLNIQAKLNARHRQMESEQKLLRSQMNPNFIFNALVSIQSFIYNNESDKAAKYLTRFARLIRLVLSNSREEFVTLRREIDMLENYLSLQKMRFENKFEYALIVDPLLDPEFIKIPPMLAQPFLDNAIELGIFGMNQPGFIELSILENDHNIIFQVFDNGNMRQNNQVKSENIHKSDALQITKERIKHLNHKHASKITFSIIQLKDKNDQVSGTIASLVIPEKRFSPILTRT